MSGVFEKLLRNVGGRRARLTMHQRPRVEELENRQLLATYSPLISAGDSTSYTGPSSSLRACIIDANSNADTTETFNLQAGTYGLTIANTNGQENACQQGDLDITAAKTYTSWAKGRARRSSMRSRSIACSRSRRPRR